MDSLIQIIRQVDINQYPNAELNNSLVFGIRGTDNPVSVGDTLQVSHVWTDNVQTTDQLGGTCAVKLLHARMLDETDDGELVGLLTQAVKQAQSYGSKIVLVCGIDTGDAVNDDWANEVIIDDCKVLAVIE